MLIAPRNVGRVANTVASQPLMSFIVGLFALAVAGFAGLVLLICCCLGLFVWLAALIAIAVGWIAVGLWVGQSLLYVFRMRDVASFLEAAVGVFLITFLSRLPLCFGGLIGLLIAALGLGAVILTRFGTQSYPAKPASEEDIALLATDMTTPRRQYHLTISGCAFTIPVMHLNPRNRTRDVARGFAASERSESLIRSHVAGNIVS